MANEVKLPRLGQGMEAGTIVKWLKSEGDTVAKGEPLYELDTDKVTQEVESDVAGTLLQIVVRDGEVTVGTTIAVIGEAGEAVAAAPEAPAAPAAAAPAPEAPAAEAAAPAPAAPAPAPAAAPAPAPAAAPAVAASADGGRVKASPLARRIARERGIDLATVVGTGPDGRIVAEDVERTATGGPAPAPAVAAAAAAPAAAPAPAPQPLRPVAPGEVRVEKLSGIRRTIARRLTEAWTAPAFQISMSADMERVQALRAGLVARTPDGAAKPTVSDVVTKLVAVALTRHPAVNALWAGEEIHLYGNVNIGLAVAVPNGLVVPVIAAAEQRTIGEIAAVRTDLVARARVGKLTPEDMQGGTFSISNLGMFGVETFIAVLNPPQAAILAVGAIQDTPVARNGQVVVRPMLNLTLTCDHRVLDGATAAEFLATVKTFLEEPGLAL